MIEAINSITLIGFFDYALTRFVHPF